MLVMGLISDRKSKKQKEKEKEQELLKNAQNRALPALVNGPMLGDRPGGARYPAGYYTTPGPGQVSHQPHHPGQPRSKTNVSPRYQTWVAPRKQQPHLGQLVS